MQAKGCHVGGYRCFERMVLGLSVAGDGSESIDFGVHLHRDRYNAIVLVVNEFGIETCNMICEGDEHVTIRLDSACAHVEYLVNDNVVCRSKAPAQGPLVCKAVNVLAGNIKGNGHLTNLPRVLFVSPADA